MRCASRRAAITACSASRARSPISPALSAWVACISQKRSRIDGSLTQCELRGMDTASTSSSCRMKLVAVGLALCLFLSPALAYTTKRDDGAACTKDGTTCEVYCDNGDLAGWIFWSGDAWTDGVRSSVD